MTGEAPGTAHPFYEARRELIVADFVGSLRLARPHFEALLPAHPLDDLLPEVVAELGRVIPTLPHVGGAAGRMTPYFESNAGVFVLGRVLRARGVAPAVAAALLRHAFLARLRAMPEAARLALGERFLSDGNKETLRRQAEASRRRENSGDFVYSFVEGEADEAFGLDYTECGFCKMSAANGDGDILPMICAMDEESYALRRVRLSRTTTLAGGARRCSFRYARLDAPSAATDEGTSE